MTQHDDHTQKRLQNKQAQWARKDKEDLDNAVMALMQHAQGRAYLYHLLTIGRAIGENPFTGNALSTSFNCGEQNVGQQIMAHIVATAPDGFLAMLKEQQNERNRRAAESARITAEPDPTGDYPSNTSGDTIYT